MKRIKISTSWDDGALEDLKLVEILSKFNVQSTLYIPIKNKEREVVDKMHIKRFSQMPNIDIGSHTYNHVYLTTVPYQVALEEVRKGKESLEDLLGKEINKFCYPGGKFTNRISDGIKGIVSNARTCNIMSVKENSRFNVDTTCHFMHRPQKSYIKQILLHAPMELKPILIKWAFSDKKSQYDLVRIFTEYVLSKQQKDFNIHIWGHSWELEECNLWGELEKTLEMLETLIER
ncbi:endo-1,4-beta-xylanase [Capnocytophaga canis]|uniref:polysaccharide deacetylase family protein n=1 Tax=Capnocytophaga canis TaxID=1848903 RepID=UPI001AD27479|nr:polysaccharide deacetylase family protein [Capnocytophaga canis]GIM61836.1 endo-1,4-beta-xylanase [Capnocytophaga canis]